MDSASTRHLAILLAAILSGAAAPPPASPVAPRHQDAPVHQAQVEARIVAAPQPVRGSDGARHLAYELRITSFQSDTDPLTLVRIAIYADDARTPLETLDGAAIGTLLAQPPQEDDPKDGVPIASGRSRTFFLWLTLPAGIPPRALRHQLVFRTGAGALQRADDIRTPVIEAAPVRIAAPLRGGRWLAAEGPGNRLSHHWGSMVAIDGTLSDPQRFAIDWFGLDDGDHAFRGPRASPAATTDEDWIGYGGDVLAVADGVVVDARDGIANGTPLAPQDTPDDLTNRTLYGNFVVLRIAPGRYAHYAHLRSGSLAVRIGQRVRRGAVIGHLGQTGAAGAPHLHFHISDRPTFEQSQGLPFVIDAFTVRDRGKRIEDMLDPDRPPPSPRPSPSAHRLEMPLDGDIITFP
jgi:murein DD-endopeptidase MepM/ murein hydrolase activator NlpD